MKLRVSLRKVMSFAFGRIYSTEGKVKVNFILEQATKAQRESSGIALLFP